MSLNKDGHFGGLHYNLIEIMKGNTTKAAVHFFIAEVFVMQHPLTHFMFHFYKLIKFLLWLLKVSSLKSNEWTIFFFH